MYLFSDKQCVRSTMCVFAGRMVAGEKKSVSNTQYKRPYGCAVISVADLLTADFKDDHLLKIYSWVSHPNFLKLINVQSIFLDWVI